ncbi:MAG: hypothetical protein KAT25_10050 [Sulfuriflexus sp.]|nr:hypothetical protein [Sulfuriflexus sp.]
MQKILHLVQRDPLWTAVFISLFISFVNVVTDDVINSDGILYSEVAGKFLAGYWLEAIAGHSWPIYALFVGVVSKITFLNFEITAQLINAGLLALLAYMFIRCSQLMGGDRLVAICAGVLLLTNVTLNGYRDLIIRDHGYWALFFTALFFFLQYHQTKLIKYALGFGFSMIIAILFRIEGIVFALLAPLILLFQNSSWKERLYQGLLPLLPLIAAGCVVLLVVFSSSTLMEKISAATHSQAGDLLGPLNYFQTTFQGIFQGIIDKGNLIEEYVFDLNARNMGTKSMIAILMMMLVVKIISACGYIPLFFSALAGFNSRLRHSMTSLNVISGFILINLLVLIVVVTTKTFLTPRYTMTFALLITLPAAFALADFFRTQISQHSVWKKRGKVLLIVILSYMFLDGLISTGASKDYLRESGLWLKKNAPAEARLFSNEESIYYYSDRNVNKNVLNFIFSETRFARLPKIVVDKSLPYDYISIKVSRKQKGFEEKVITWAGSKPIHRDSNQRGDALLIFKVKR